jgi:solute carrier family 25 carnitine/acylcarnitine transporter 20/29
MVIIMILSYLYYKNFNIMADNDKLYEIKKYSMIDFFMGGISGAIGAIVSHPIDTVKSNIQSNNKIKWGIRDLYRGVRAPIIGVGLEKAIVFGTYENTKNFLENNNMENKYAIRGSAGGCAGIMAAFAVAPVDRVKILAQTNQTWTRKDLNPKFLFTGLSSTLTREPPGFAIYFMTYHGLKDHFSKLRDINILDHFAFGGISGGVSWLFIYPQDTIKTIIQSTNVNSITDKTKLTMKNVGIQIYNKNGVRGFFKGFHLSLMRAVPLHAGTFAMMEFLKKRFA